MTSGAALAFLPFATAIGVWVAWSDMKFMRIPNQSVIALALVWLGVGPFVLPLATWLLGMGLGIAVLIAGFIGNRAGLFGAGDAKFAAAMAPFFVQADWRFLYVLFAACLIGAFATHRGLRLIGPLRSATPDWASWTHKKFPMGFALSGALIFYLLVLALRGPGFTIS